MAIHRFQTPDGKIHRVEAATRQDAEAELNRALAPKAAETWAAKRFPKNGQSFIQGPTLGFGDELQGLVARVETAGANLGRRVTGRDIPFTSAEAAAAAQRQFRDAEAAERSASPGGAMASTVMGGFAAPGSKAAGAFVAGGKGLLGMAGRGAAVGAGYGAAAGAGANNEDRVGGAVGGGTMGALAGGLLPPAMMGAQRVLGPTVTRGVDAVRGGLSRVSPEFTPPPTRVTPKELRVAAALDRARARDTASGVPRRQSGLPFQAEGDNVAAIAEVLAQSPGPAQGVIRSAAANSRAGQRVRMKEAIGEGIGGKGNYFETLDKITEARRAAANEGMAVLADKPIQLDGDSVLALRSDLARTAIRDAANNSLASPDPAVREAGAALNRLAGDVLDNPAGVVLRVRDAQDISRALLKAADGAYRQGDGGRGEALKALGKSVRDNAANPQRGGLPEYGAWLKRYGDDSENIEALELGRTVLSNTLDNNPEKIARTLADMSDVAKEHFRKGVGEALLSEVRRKGIGAGRALLKDEDFAAKIKLAFPTDEGFKAFMALADDAVAIEARNTRVLDNSRTDARGAARADLNAEGAGAGDVAEMFLSPGSIPGKAAKAGLNALPRRDRSLVGDAETNAMLGKAMIDPDEMDRFLNILEAERARSLRGLRPAAYLTAPLAQAPNR